MDTGVFPRKEAQKMLFDTHAHYDDGKFDQDRYDLLAAMPAAGIAGIVNNGTTVESSRFSLALAERYPFVYAAVGIHPEEMDDYTPAHLDQIETLLQREKAVAVGEIGLDYYWRQDNKDLQKQALRQQLELARAYRKPAVIHIREAMGDALAILEGFPDVRLVLHCYAGSWETAKVLLSQGRYLSFNGVLTFKNARKSVEVVAQMPLDRLMLETDSPYLAPVPFRGRRNSSLYLEQVARKVAEIRGIPQEEVEAVTTANAKAFFGLA